MYDIINKDKQVINQVLETTKIKLFLASSWGNWLIGRVNDCVWWGVLFSWGNVVVGGND